MRQVGKSLSFVGCSSFCVRQRSRHLSTKPSFTETFKSAASRVRAASDAVGKRFWNDEYVKNGDKHRDAQDGKEKPPQSSRGNKSAGANPNQPLNHQRREKPQGPRPFSGKELTANERRHAIKEEDDVRKGYLSERRPNGREERRPERRLARAKTDHVHGTKASHDDLGDQERLSKYLSRCGVASRRTAEVMIKDGRVKVNGEVVIEVGHKVNPFDDVIMVDGVVTTMINVNLWVMMNKPKDVLSTVADDRGRKTVMKYVNSFSDHLVPIGRLDRDSTGLLLLTTEKAWVEKLTHPRYQHWKEYEVVCTGHVTDETITKLENGIYLPGEDVHHRKTAPAKFTITAYVKDKGEPATRMHIMLREGRKRQIRRMLYAFYHDVITLHRQRFVGLELGNLRPGEARALSAEEVEEVKRRHEKDQSQQRGLF